MIGYRQGPFILQYIKISTHSTKVENPQQIPAASLMGIVVIMCSLHQQNLWFLLSLSFLSTYIFVHLIRCLKRIRRSGVQTLIIIPRKYFLLSKNFWTSDLSFFFKIKFKCRKLFHSFSCKELLNDLGKVNKVFIGSLEENHYCHKWNKVNKFI